MTTAGETTRIVSDTAIVSGSSHGHLQVQCILYQLAPEKAARTAEFVDCAARHAIAKGLIDKATLTFGDCSPTPAFDRAAQALLKAKCTHLADVTVAFFNQNLGHGGGQNRLLARSTADLTLILNPDIIVAPNLLIEMICALQRPGVGLVEARQMPSEHPKDFDPLTGQTSWGSGACLLLRTMLLRDLGGFDDEAFFMYCDDVDLCWRARLAGFGVVYQPTAVCFHDKRLDDDARWLSSDAERYYSAEAALMLAHKYSRPELVSTYLRQFTKSDDANLHKAAAEFSSRQAAGRLPNPLDAEHQVSQFIEGNYAKHRFKAR